MIHRTPFEPLILRQSAGRPALLLALDALPTGLIGADVFIAGGAVRRSLMGQAQVVSDLDLFFQGHEALTRAREILQTSGFDKRSESGVAEIWASADGPGSLDLHYRRFFASGAEVVDGFDFGMCQFALEFGADGPALVYTAEAFADLIAGILLPHEPGITDWQKFFRRVAKYEGQGFAVTIRTLEHCVDIARRRPDLAS